MIRKLLGKVYRRIKKIRTCVRNTPILCDKSISMLLYGCHSRKEDYCKERLAPNPLFYTRQFVGHGRYYINVPNNSLLLYEELIRKGFKIIECDVMFTKDLVPVLCHDDNIASFAKDEQGRAVNKQISKLTYDELKRYNFSDELNKFVEITKFETIISLAKDKHVCVEIDLEKLYLGRKKYRILYDIVKRHDMLQNVIWEVLPSDFYSILLCDPRSILQLNHTWTYEAIERFKRYQNFSPLIILSEWFPGTVEKDYSEIVKAGHQNGYLMKCATLNDYNEAYKMFAQSVDLITTDTLNNDLIQDII